MAEKATKATYEELEQRVRELEDQVHDRDRGESLWEAYEFNRQIFDVSPVGIAIYSTVGRCILANDTMASILDAPLGEILAQDFRGNRSWIESGLLGDAEKVLSQGMDKHRDIQVEISFGRTVWLACQLSRFISDDKPYLVTVFSDITARKQAEEALSQSEQRLSLHVERTPLGVVEWNLDFEVVEWNPAAEQIFGFTKEEAIGRHGSELIVPQSATKQENRIWMDLCAKQGGLRSTNENCRKGGEIILCEWYNTPLIDHDGQILGVASLVLDITERRRVEQALQDREEMLRSMFETAPDIILNMDQEGNILFINHGVSGTTRAQAIGTNVYDHIQPEYHEAHREALEKVFQTGEVQGLELAFRPKGHSQDSWQAARIGPMKREGDIVGATMISRDITEHKRAEEERGSLEEQLRLSRRMEAIGTLAGGIAHDFNNILAAITGYTELALLESGEKTRLRSNLEQVLQGGKRARDLVKRILAFSRQGEQDRKPVDVNAITVECLKFIQVSMPPTVRVREDVLMEPGLILADSSQIFQVLVNLCANASHAMGEKGGLLDVKLTVMDLDAEGAAPYPDLGPGAYMKLTVSDSGHGMTKEVMERIFHPFFTTKEPGEGTGMGLSVVHGIVKSHGGAITVQSEVGKGSTFQVLLPKLEDQTSSETEVVSPVSVETSTILFVDDEEAIVDYASQMLKHFGCESIAKTSSLEALEAFRADPDRFDLVITDLTMPNMTGVELSQELVQIRPDVPIILCTGFSEIVTAEEARAMGIRELLMKPILIDELTGAIQRVLGEKETKPEATEARILVVDDDDQMRGMLRQMLELEGHEVVEACDGKIGIKLYREEPTDIIITDLVMPEKEGVELIMELSREFPGVKIIAISGGGRIEAGEYLPVAKGLGAMHTFEKPFNREDLLDAVRDVLDQ